LERWRDVEVGAVQVGDRLVDQLLVPRSELVDAFDGAGVVGVEVLDHLVDRRTGDDALGDAAHGVLDAVQLFPTPRVRLVEIEVDAVEIAREERVAVAADGIARVGRGRVLLAEVRGEPGVTRGRDLGRLREGRVVGTLGRERPEERGLVGLAAPRRGLLRAGERLTPRRHDSRGHALAQRGLDARE
jgi:hypothetical protein